MYGYNMFFKFLCEKVLTVTLRTSKRHWWRSMHMSGQLYRRENTVTFHMHSKVIRCVSYSTTLITQDYVEMILFVAVYIFSSNTVTYFKPQTIHSINVSRVAVTYDHCRKQGHIL